MITYIIIANTAIAIAPSHPVSNIALNTANIPMIPTIIPINGKPMNPENECYYGIDYEGKKSSD